MTRVCNRLEQGDEVTNPFIDRNKRAALMTLMVVLRLNGVNFRPDQAEAAAAIIGVDAGEIEEEGLARWIRDRWPKDVPRK